MRLSLWLILILAFSVGMGCALALRDLYFNAQPVTAQTPEPLTRILVAKRTIPSGVEITADFVVLQEVAVSEVPLGSIARFSQVYRRQSAYPIPTGCPVCEDLLLPKEETAPESAFIPIGSQFVTLDVARIWQGNRIFVPTQPLSTLLGADQRVDIRIVPRDETQGRLADIKNEVLRTFAAPDFKNSGELVLENVPIHRVQRQFAAQSAGSIRDSIMLMLDRSEAARLTAAAKKGQIRLLVRLDEESVPVLAEERTFAATEPPRELLPAPLPIEQPLPQDVPLDTPFALEQSGSVVFVPTAPSETVAKTAPVPADVFDSALMLPPDPGFTLLPVAREGEIPLRLHRSDQQPNDPVDTVFPEFESEEKVSIRNDVPIAPFGRMVPPLTPPAHSVEHSATVLPLLTHELGESAIVPSHSEAVLGPPRMTQSIQFVSPGNVAPVGEYPREIARRAESLLPSAGPSAESVLAAPKERTGTPGYSPFERRIYTVLPSDETEKSPGKELPAPPRLQKNSDGTQGE